MRPSYSRRAHVSDGPQQVARHWLPSVSEGRGTRGRIAPPPILRQRLQPPVWSSRRGRRRRRRDRDDSSRMEAAAVPTRAHRPSRCSSLSDRSVSTKLRSSSAAHPDNHSEAGSAPMNENSPAQASVASPFSPATRPEVSISSPSRPTILALARRSIVRGRRAGRLGSGTCSRSGRVRG